jgi:Cytochrome oxidase complex assembly protein 1
MIMVVVFGAIKSSDAYKGALGRAKADSRVTEAIGKPIKEGWYVGGKTEVSGGSGTSDLTIPIQGPNGKATIYAVATKFAGEWKYSKLVVKIDGTGEVIDLTGKETEPDDE